MQELIKRAKELLADGTVVRFLGGKPEILPLIRNQLILKHRNLWRILSMMDSAVPT